MSSNRSTAPLTERVWFYCLVLPILWALALALPMTLAAIVWWNHTGQPWVWY